MYFHHKVVLGYLQGVVSRTAPHPLNPESAATAKLLQSCLTLCDLINGSPPGSPVPGILQAEEPGGLQSVGSQRVGHG